MVINTLFVEVAARLNANPSTRPERHLGSISSAIYQQLSVFLALLGSGRAKAACKTSIKLTPCVDFINICSQLFHAHRMATFFLHKAFCYLPFAKKLQVQTVSRKKAVQNTFV